MGNQVFFLLSEYWVCVCRRDKERQRESLNERDIVEDRKERVNERERGNR